jgi:hypothetical protein
MKTNVAKEHLLLVYVSLFSFAAVLLMGLLRGNEWLTSVRNGLLGAVVAYFLMQLFLKLYYHMLEESLREKAQEIEKTDDKRS